MKLIISKLTMESNLLSLKSYVFLFLLICQITLLAQPPSSVVRGRITGNNGQPLEGATINERGTRNSATTGQNATFRLNVQNANATLVISYIGYQPLFVPIKGTNGTF